MRFGLTPVSIATPPDPERPPDGLKLAIFELNVNCPSTPSAVSRGVAVGVGVALGFGVGVGVGFTIDVGDGVGVDVNVAVD